MGNETLQQLFDSILNGNQKAALQLVQQALDENLSSTTILNEGMGCGNVTGRPTL